MPYSSTFTEPAPNVQDLSNLSGMVVLEFGAPWCGHCQGAQPAIRQALEHHPAVTHIKVEDGPGHPLGRHFRVKLWPTLVVLHQGHETARVVRPASAQDVLRVLA